MTTREPWSQAFLYGARPRSLDAARIKTRLLPKEQDQNPHRLRLACPNGRTEAPAANPKEEADDQYLHAGLLPAEVYQMTGADWDVTAPWGGGHHPGCATGEDVVLRSDGGVRTRLRDPDG